ncbi:MAG TPA: hypothetical protein VI072_17625 [Polyangiaceae bacterium]
MAHVERTDGTLYEVQGEFDALVHARGVKYQFLHPVNSELRGNTLVVRSSNRAATPSPLHDVQRVEVTQPDTAKTVLAVIAVAVVIGGGGTYALIKATELPIACARQRATHTVECSRRLTFRVGSVDAQRARRYQGSRGTALGHAIACAAFKPKGKKHDTHSNWVFRIHHAAQCIGSRRLRQCERAQPRRNRVREHELRFLAHVSQQQRLPADSDAVPTLPGWREFILCGIRL